MLEKERERKSRLERKRNNRKRVGLFKYNEESNRKVIDNFSIG